MLSETLHRELSSYQLGAKLRGLRVRKAMTLAELASHSGLSTAMLSKLETGRLVPTLPTLTRIALVFSVGLDYFFTDEQRKWPVSITRADERVRFPAQNDAGELVYRFESLDFPAVERKLNSYLAEFEASDDPASHTHEGVEFLYVIEGALALVVHGAEQVLQAGDAAYFPGHVLHGYRRIGERPARAIVVTVPGRST